MTRFTRPRFIIPAFYSVLSATLAGLLWTFSGQVYNLLWTALAFIVLLGMGGFWLAYLVFFRDTWSRTAWVAWAIPAPIVVMTTALLIGIGAPAQARWAVSRSAFNHTVAHLDAGGGGHDACDKATGWIGAFKATSIFASEGGYVFTTDTRRSDILGGESGIAYLPHGARDYDLELVAGGPVVFQHLEGPWYTWVAEYD